MKLIRTVDAAGQVLCHDITQIIPGEFKGPRFRKGHIVQPEDIPVLLSIGKENLYVWEKRPGILHEDEAAALLYKAAAGKNIHGTVPFPVMILPAAPSRALYSTGSASQGMDFPAASWSPSRARFVSSIMLSSFPAGSSRWRM